MICANFNSVLNNSFKLFGQVKSNLTCIFSNSDFLTRMVAVSKITSLLLGGALAFHAAVTLTSTVLIVTAAKVAVAAALVVYGVVGSSLKKKNDSGSESESNGGENSNNFPEIKIQQGGGDPKENKIEFTRQNKQEPKIEAKIEPKIEINQGISEKDIIDLGAKISRETFKDMDVAHIRKFLDLGGKINNVVPGAKIFLKKEGVTYYTGCNAGQNRSTAAYGFLLNHGITPKGVFTGQGSAFNPFGHIQEPNKPDENEKVVYREVYGVDKPSALGAELVYPIYDFKDAKAVPQELRKYYQDIVEDFPQNTHIIAFGSTFYSSIYRLLDSQRAKSGSEKPLSGIEISYFDWADTIQMPFKEKELSNLGIESNSIQAFRKFNEKLAEVFVFEE